VRLNLVARADRKKFLINCGNLKAGTEPFKPVAESDRRVKK
jgi:hypothetical protein